MAEDTTDSSSPDTTNPTINITQTALDEKIAATVKDAIKDIKGKLDNAYSSRDELQIKVAGFEDKQRQEEIDKLKADGKNKEAFEAELAEEKRKTFEAEEASRVKDKKIEVLSRDNELRNVLSELDFKNSKASESAFNEISSNLVKDEDGNWVHKSSSADISTYVEAFATEEDNDYLFNVKTSSGSGGDPSTQSSSNVSDKSLSSMSQEEVLNKVRLGKLKRGGHK